MRVTDIPRSPAQGPRLVVWLIQGTPHTTVRLWQLCPSCGEDALTELPPPLLERQHDGTSIVCPPLARRHETVPLSRSYGGAGC